MEFSYAVAQRSRGSLEKPRPLPGELVLTLAGARSLRVKTIDRAGRPIAGVKVGPWHLRKPGQEADINLSGTSALWTATDADGVAVIDWLPERFEGGLPIIIHSEDYYAPDFPTALKAGEPVDVMTIPLLPLERLSGRVTHADGSPAAGIVVAAQGRGASDYVFQGSTRTGTDGRYAMRVYSEQAYVIAVHGDGWAAPYRADVVVRAGKPAAGGDFVLGRATRLHGRVTVGTEGRPVPETGISVVIDKGNIPGEIRREGDQFSRRIRMSFGEQTDADGRFEFELGPGEYELRGPVRTESIKLTIPAADPPAEIVHDFQMPRPEAGPFTGRVVDAQG